MRRIEPALRRALRGPCRVDPGELILVAVSGGADSTALLVGLRRLQPEFGYRLDAAHLHHGLRGGEADLDLGFVRELCEGLDVPLDRARWDTKARMRGLGLRGQEGLRRLRAEFIESIARRRGAVRVATGHTADDQLETLLFRLLRGTGLAGLGAMSARNGRWIRPLLSVSRDQIEADLRAIRQPWREDSSNRDLVYARNRIRHLVIPALLEVGPSTPPRDRGALARQVGALLEEARQAKRLIAHLATRALAASAAPGQATGEVDLEVTRLRRLPLPVRRETLRMAWRSLSAGAGLTARQVGELSKLVDRALPGSVHLPGGRNAIRTRGRLRIGTRSGRIEPPEPGSSVPVPGRIAFGPYDFRTSWLSGDAARSRLERRAAGEVFDAEGLEGELQLRHGRSDEWFVPHGRRAPYRLGRFLSREGVETLDRKGPMVLADAQGILWVVGVRRSARAALTARTRKALWIHRETR